MKQSSNPNLNPQAKAEIIENRHCDKLEGIN